MECSCNASSECYDNDDMIGYTERKLKAAKTHVCCECGETINKKEYFIFCSIFLNVPAIHNFKLCLNCYELSNIFFADGMTFLCMKTMLEAHFRNNWQEDLPSNCISKLSKRNKEIICDFLQQYQES